MKRTRKNCREFSFVLPLIESRAKASELWLKCVLYFKTLKNKWHLIKRSCCRDIETFFNCFSVKEISFAFRLPFPRD